MNDLEWALSNARNEYFNLMDYNPWENELIEYLRIRIKSLENEIERKAKNSRI